MTLILSCYQAVLGVVSHFRLEETPHKGKFVLVGFPKLPKAEKSSCFPQRPTAFPIWYFFFPKTSINQLQLQAEHGGEKPICLFHDEIPVQPSAPPTKKILRRILAEMSEPSTHPVPSSCCAGERGAAPLPPLRATTGTWKFSKAWKTENCKIQSGSFCSFWERPKPHPTAGLFRALPAPQHRAGAAPFHQ